MGSLAQTTCDRVRRMTPSEGAGKSQGYDRGSRVDVERALGAAIAAAIVGRIG